MRSIIYTRTLLCLFASTEAFQSILLRKHLYSDTHLLATSRGTKRRTESPRSHQSGRNTSSKRRQRKNLTTDTPATDSSNLRPILTDYEANRNFDTNKQRLVGDIACPHFDTCSGCSISSKVAQVDTVQSARLFFSSTLIQKNRIPRTFGENDDSSGFPIVVPSRLTEWRTQAKLAVAPKSSSWAKDGCAFGLFARGTHNVLPIPDCKVHHPSINRALALLEAATAKAMTPPYTGKRDMSLRYVQLQVERLTNKICLTLVWNAENLKDTHPHLTRLTKELQRLDPQLWHSMWCHCNDGPGNNIFSRNPKRWHRLSGPEFVREPFAVGDMGWLYFSPLNFRQANMDGFDILARDVAQAVPGGAKVCELYAGVGLLGLTSLVYHSDKKPLVWIRCSDENPSNPRSFEKAVDSLPQKMTGRGEKYSRSGEDEETLTLAELAAMMNSGKVEGKAPRPGGDKTSYHVSDAVAALRSGQALGANVMIVDPPRKGLEPEVLNELCKPHVRAQPYVESAPALMMIPKERINWVNDVDTLIYVSCGFDALARETEELLTSNAGWQIVSSTGYILFPGSNHIETVCVFKRKLT